MAPCSTEVNAASPISSKGRSAKVNATMAPIAAISAPASGSRARAPRSAAAVVRNNSAGNSTK
jgi:membrane-bound ClpP family serine protease